MEAIRPQRNLGPATVLLAVVVLVLVSAVAVSAAFADRIVPGTSVGPVPLGNLTTQEAALRLQEHLDLLARGGIPVQIEDQYETVLSESIGLDLNIQESVELAFARGHEGPWWRQGAERMASLWSRRQVPAAVFVDESLLDDRIDDLGRLSDVARKDVRLSISGTTVTVLTDTRPGKVVDRELARALLLEHIRALRLDSLAMVLHADLPRATMASAVTAKEHAERMIASPVQLVYEDLQFVISRTVLASWLVNGYQDDRLVPTVDKKATAQYVTHIAEQLNLAAESAGVTTQDGRITGFTPPTYGRAVQEDETVMQIHTLLQERADGTGARDTITIPMRQTKPPSVALGDGTGISELIGRATTPFTGSPKNRVSNIKNGARFLSGAVVQPDQEFSTLGQLGTIDNTTGYLPELVIKGDRTTPEYGGGLCQVSTTLFRAALDAGLPITARRNHSFRVGYYEKDENGRFIGPGLDATIYEPDLDMKFLNDTGNPILILSYVHGTLITFELYGTKDGRTSAVTGPTVLTEVPAGEPVYIETDELAAGKKRQVEWAHPGGSAVARYAITYADGRTKEQEFKSWYRRWPDVFLVGRGPEATPMVAP